MEYRISIDDFEARKLFLQNFRVLRRQHRRVTFERQHLELGKLPQPQNSGLQVTKIVEGNIKAKQSWENLDELCESWLANLVQAEANVNHLHQRLGCAQADLIDLVSIQVQLLQTRRQELQPLYLVERKVDHLQILKLRQRLVNPNDALALHVELTEEVDDIIFHTHVLDRSQFLYYLGQIDGFRGPIQTTKLQKQIWVTYHCASSSSA